MICVEMRHCETLASGKFNIKRWKPLGIAFLSEEKSHQTLYALQFDANFSLYTQCKQEKVINREVEKNGKKKFYRLRAQHTSKNDDDGAVMTVSSINDVVTMLKQICVLKL